MAGGIGGIGFLNTRMYAPPVRDLYLRATDPRAAAEDGRVRMREVQAQVVMARRAIEALQEVLGTRRVRAGSGADGPASVTSAVALDIDTTATAAALRSADEVNATPTSFSPFGPDWSKSSTALATFGGVYAGTMDDTLTLEVQTEGTVGVDDIRIRVRNGEGTPIDVFDLDASYVPGSILELSNGLTLQLGAGDLVRKDKAYLDVSASVGSAVDPTKPFDGTRNDNPSLEVGQAVTTGSFTVNGTEVAVSASDSLQDVVDRITATVDGVTATFDAASERVVLTSDVAGEGQDIAVADDTSGFLAATKLDTATLEAGTDGAQGMPMADVAALVGVLAGTVTVNGIEVAIDPSADSLDDALARIQATVPGVTASFDAATQKVTIGSADGEALVLDDGSSGLFAALGIAAGTYEAESRPSSAVRAERRAFARQVSEALEDVQREMNRLFDRLDSPSLEESRDVTRVRTRVAAALRTEFEGDPENLRSGFGVDFSLAEDADQLFDFGASEQQVFRRAFVTSHDRVLDFLVGRRGQRAGAGLVGGLLSALQTADADLREKYGSVGVLVNRAV